MKKVQKTTNKVGIIENAALWILFFILLVLKLNPGGNFTTDVVNWSWWIIFLPLWIGPAIALAVFLVVFISIIFLGIAGKKDE